jgi:hypothetical protein
MTARKARVSKSPMTKVNTDIAETVREGMKEHPDVHFVLEIAAQARMMEAHAQPIELDSASDLTLTPTISQIPGL